MSIARCLQNERMLSFVNRLCRSAPRQPLTRATKTTATERMGFAAQRLQAPIAAVLHVAASLNTLATGAHANVCGFWCMTALSVLFATRELQHEIGRHVFHETLANSYDDLNQLVKGGGARRTGVAFLGVKCCRIRGSALIVSGHLDFAHLDLVECGHCVTCSNN